MPAYIQGNLAVEPKTGQNAKTSGDHRPASPRKTLPLQEKLLYLFTVAVCVIVACVVVWRYAQIYEMNAKIHKIEQQISQLEAENSRLRLEIGKLQSPQRLIDEAKQRGFQPVADGQISRIPATTDDSRSSGDVALNR